MMNRIRSLLSYAFVATTLLGSVAFTTLWLVGPFCKLGVVVPCPFIYQSIDVHTGAGMMHATFNQRRRLAGWWYVYDYGMYPPDIRAANLRLYFSLSLPKSPGQKTSFGRKSWEAGLWVGESPAPRYLRVWFPTVIPTVILNTMVLLIAARWRSQRLRSASNSNADRNHEVKSGET